MHTCNPLIPANIQLCWIYAETFFLTYQKRSALILVTETYQAQRKHSVVLFSQAVPRPHLKCRYTMWYNQAFSTNSFYAHIFLGRKNTFEWLFYVPVMCLLLQTMYTFSWLCLFEQDNASCHKAKISGVVWGSQKWLPRYQSNWVTAGSADRPGLTHTSPTSQLPGLIDSLCRYHNTPSIV